MNNITVDGFNNISFWREDDIGLIVLKTDKNSDITRGTIDEIILALTSASLDDMVKCVGFTGQNNLFAKDIKIEKSDLVNLLESARTLSSSIASFEKPLFSLLNGPTYNAGYELATLSDYVISTSENEVGFYGDYEFVMGGSLASQRFRSTNVSSARADFNVDMILDRNNFLGDSAELMNRMRSSIQVQLRRTRLRDIHSALQVEHFNFLKNRYLALVNDCDLTKKELMR